MLSEQQKRDFCAIMLQKYGVNLDVGNELLPVFYIAYKSAVISENTSKQTQQHLLKIISDFEKNTASKISKLETKQFHFHNSSEAFWFAFGKIGATSIILALFLFAGWFIYLNREKEKQESLYFSNFLRKVQLQQKEIDTINRVHHITLYPQKTLKEAEAGKHYVYNKECNCIEIPFFYETVKEK
jgi:hypothetical protein